MRLNIVFEAEGLITQDSSTTELIKESKIQLENLKSSMKTVRELFGEYEKHRCEKKQENDYDKTKPVVRQ